MKAIKQTIVCPGCYSPTDAQVTLSDGDQFWSYVHVCTVCSYLITESEWDVVEETDRCEWYDPLGFHGDED